MKRYLKISEFARLSGIKRKNLIFYDEIGLLSPERVEQNGYRYYSYPQLETVSVISALQELGMSLRDIKCYLDERSPDKLIDLFTVQHENVKEKIFRLTQIQQMIETRLQLTHRGQQVDPDVITLSHCKEEWLFAGDEITGEDEQDIENAMVAFYDYGEQEHMIYGHPLGTILSREKLLNRRLCQPSRYFFKFPPEQNIHTGITKPAGLYLIGYGEVGVYEFPIQIYERLFSYIEKNGLRIIGNSYEEFLLDEIALQPSALYLVQVSVQVEHM